jgi:hypothetical protein
MVVYYDLYTYVCVVWSTTIVLDSIHGSTERFVVSDVAIVRNRILQVVDLQFAPALFAAHDAQLQFCVYQPNLWPSWKYIL